MKLENEKDEAASLNGTNGAFWKRIRAKMKRPRAFQEFRNLRVLPSGYQVSVTRGKMEFSKHFAGHSAKSLQAAMRYRDQLRRELPDKRKNIVPRRLWAALNLKRPAVGVFRHPKRHMYQVTYRDRDGRLRTRAFGWTDRAAEIDAYAAAVKFRKKCLAG
ncbi:MAG: hypothetical protein DME49_02020 [Verrucomicrobia bacterium]|nr:MAG: hypothetical protein DME49_02020 [Verrucomicrobiota bacterium]